MDATINVVFAFAKLQENMQWNGGFAARDLKVSCNEGIRTK